MPILRPTHPTERLEVLDVLRGFALCGVFAVNAFVAARPFDEALAPPVEGPALERLAWGVFDALLLTKFVAIFSLLFGAGFALQCQRARERAAPFRTIHRRRLTFLGLLGLLHGCLLFEGDILLPYAVAGTVLYRLRRSSPARLARWAAAVWCVGVALSVAASFWTVPATSPVEGTMLDAAKRHGPFSAVLAARPGEYAGWLLVSSLISFNWRVVALLLLGAASMKSGLWASARVALHRRIALLGCLLGGAVEVSWSWLRRDGVPPTPLARIAGTVADELGSVALAAGYAALIALAVRGGALAPLRRGLAAVGRTALSNDLLQSVLMNLAFYTVGLSLYGRLSRAAVLGWVLPLFALQVWGSLWWTRRYGAGPVERVWRRLTYGGQGAS